MNKWKDLKVYRNLPPKVIPLSFKLFAHYLIEKLNVDFILKESKTFKKLIYKSSEYFEISLVFSNESSERNDTRIKSYIGFRFKYKDIDSIIIDTHDIDNSIKTHEPLTKEFLLLADFWFERIEKYIVPYLEKILTPANIICNATELKEYYKNENEYNSHFRSILFECAFLTKNSQIFNEIYNEKIKEENQQIIQHKDSKELFIKKINFLNKIKKIFDDDSLYKVEIKKRKELITSYKP